MGTSDLKLNLWLKQRPRLMLCYSKADRGILIGSLLQISKHMSAYRTTYQPSSSCRFLLRWSWRGERRLNANRPAKHGVLPGSVAGSKCTGKNYTGRLWRQFLERVFGSKFCPSAIQSCQDFSHPSVTLVENCQDLTTLAATL